HGRTDETESAALQVLAECVRFRRSCRNLPHRIPLVELRPAANETPAVGVETPELFLDFEKRTRVTHCSFDLQAVANDSSIQHESPDPSPRESRHLLGIEPVKSPTVTLSLLQHDRPTQSRLRGFEHKKLEMLDVIVDRYSPFPIVILHHQRVIGAYPGTA